MWVAENKEIVAKETYVAAALIAEQQLGFRVTHSNMSWACMACGIEKQKPRGAGNKDRVRALALILRNFMASCGAETPDELHRLITGITT